MEVSNGQRPVQYTIILFYTIHNYIVLYNTQLYCFI
jgi:hypothetical protein